MSLPILSDTLHRCADDEAQYPGCTRARCREVLRRRAAQAESLLRERIAAAEAADRQLIVISHYPTTYFGRKEALGIGALLRNPRVRIANFGGHVHSTDDSRSVDRSYARSGWSDWCVGGGGGWACDGHQGFVVGEVLSNGRVANLRVRLVSDGACCLSNPRG